MEPGRSTTSQPVSVLVVEDDETIRESVVEFLEEEGYRACGVTHGGLALAQLAAAPVLPSLILLDLMMPIMDGRSFRREQLRDARLANIPVVVFSALVDAAPQASDMKVAGFLKKPFSLVDLLDLVKIHCGEPAPAV